MTDLLIITVLSGFAVTYTVELLFILTFSMFMKSEMYKWLTLPLSFGAVFSQVHLNKTLIIAVPAATFISLVVNTYINTPVVSNFQRLTRGR